MNPCRVLILADESADWVVAGLRQLDRIALCLDEVATGIVSVTVFWRPDLERSRHWVPEHPRLTKIRFATEPAFDSYDLVASTRLFLYRKAVGAFIEETTAPITSLASWDECFERMKAGVQPRPGAWEFIPAPDAIGGI